MITVKKQAVLAAVTIFAAVMLLGPVSSGIGSVYAKEYNSWDDCRDDHSKNWCTNYFEDNHDNGNAASQEISQKQSSEQNSQCVSGDDTSDSCNNFSFQNQENEGNNALGQN
jgi:hypothetical protein